MTADWRRAIHYAVAISSIAAAAIVRRLLDPMLAERFPFATLFLAVLVTALVGGFRPALVSSILGLGAAAVWLEGPDKVPLYASEVGRSGLVLYSIVALGIAALGGSSRNAKERARRAERNLIERDERKNHFIAMLSHELRNPLSAIRMSVSVAQDNATDHEVRRAIDAIDRQSRQIERLAADLMDAARIAHGKVELQRQVCDVRDVVERSVEASRPALIARRQELETRLPEEPVAVEGDPARLQQVFDNLLSNAARYTEPGGQIQVTANRAGEAVAVRVSDTGIGIPPENVHRIFEPFVQLHNGERGGLGIGLALVKNLVELHGGTIAVRSEGVGKGTEVVVKLPVTAQPIRCA